MRRLALVAFGCSLLPCPAVCENPPAPGQPYECGSINRQAGTFRAERPVANCYLVLAADGPRALETAHLPQLEQIFQASTPIPLLGGYVVRGVQASSLAALEPRDLVLYECEEIDVSPMPVVSLDEDPDWPPPRVQPTAAVWGLDRIDQRDRSLDGDYDPDGSGAGVRIGINDTGEPMQMAGWRNVAPCMTAVAGCKDDHDHGSHVGGISAHETYGVAPDSEIAWCKSLINGSGSSADVIECVQKITDWCAGHGPCIGNMSLGGSPDDPIDEAVCNSREAGVVWVVAAGNESDAACGHSPARGEAALTVGATDSGDGMAGFSNQGACVDVNAPGVSILSVGRRGNRITMSGTGMAAPHVAGIAALCAERLATADPDAIEACVLEVAGEGKLSGVDPESPNLLGYAKAE